MGFLWTPGAAGGQNFSSPPPIGDVTPNTGNFTALTAAILVAQSLRTPIAAGSVIVSQGVGASATGVAPGAAGNVLTSQGGVWVSVAPAAGGTLPSFSNSIGANIAISNGAFTTGPTVAQGVVGTFLAMGTVTIKVPQTGLSTFLSIKLWDGVTVMASTGIEYPVTLTGQNAISVSLSGVITNPAGNIRISAFDNIGGGGSGAAFLNSISSQGKDSTLVVVQIG